MPFSVPHLETRLVVPTAGAVERIRLFRMTSRKLTTGLTWTGTDTLTDPEAMLIEAGPPGPFFLEAKDAPNLLSRRERGLRARWFFLLALPPGSPAQGEGLG
jgi:hypothetical protein